MIYHYCLCLSLSLSTVVFSSPIERLDPKHGRLAFSYARVTQKYNFPNFGNIADDKQYIDPDTKISHPVEQKIQLKSWCLDPSKVNGVKAFPDLSPKNTAKIESKYLSGKKLPIFNAPFLTLFSTSANKAQTEALASVFELYGLKPFSQEALTMSSFRTYLTFTNGMPYFIKFDGGWLTESRTQTRKTVMATIDKASLAQRSRFILPEVLGVSFILDGGLKTLDQSYLLRPFPTLLLNHKNLQKPVLSFPDMH